MTAGISQIRYMRKHGQNLFFVVLFLELNTAKLFVVQSAIEFNPY